VGRLKNLADDVTEPVEIKHANSGERIKLDSSGFGTKRINDRDVYAAGFSGSSPDARLNNALTAINAGRVLHLEPETYTQDFAVNERITLAGTIRTAGRTKIDAQITLLQRTSIERLFMPNGLIQVNDGFCHLSKIRGANISVADNKATVTSSDFVDVTFDSGTSQGIVDTCTNSSVTDNGNNTVGDIS
jgi:propanediol utilization protein